MVIQFRKPFFNYFKPFAKNVTRKYAVPVSIKDHKTENVNYPPILDLSPKARLKRKRDEWHGKIRKLETVEEKLYGINMPYYYGWNSVTVDEGNIPYNGLSHAQYITRTNIVNDDKLPDYYNTFASEQIDSVLQNVKSFIQDAILFEYVDKVRNQLPTETIGQKKKLKDHITNAIIYQINRLMLSSLSSTLPHLMEAEVDFNPRIEAFWLAGGAEPPAKVVKRRKTSTQFKDMPNDPIDIPYQYIGSPILQLRNQFPLKEFVPLVDSMHLESSIPEFKYSPKTLGYSYSNKHAVCVPGFWPGDPAEFGLMSYHNTNHLSTRPETYKDDVEAVTVQAIYASYSWLLSQACYQGFSTVDDITYPLVTQTILTNGQWWTFCAYQLNTTYFRSDYIDKNPVSNMCWITKPMALFDSVEDGKIHGFNEDVLKTLIQFYMNIPEERVDVDMKPYLGKSVKRIADIPDDDRRKWLEQHFKHLMSNRSRHFKIPEIHQWQRIYMIRHPTRPLEKRRDPWQFGYNPWKRRLDDHLPIYIPRCLRENPKKRKVGRWAKTYYPDA